MDEDLAMSHSVLVPNNDVVPNTINPAVFSLGSDGQMLNGAPSDENTTVSQLEPKSRGSTSSPSVEFDRGTLQYRASLPLSTLPTGLCYDVRMRFHCEIRTEPNRDHHPEDPRRISSIFGELVEAGLVKDPYAEKYFTSDRLVRIPVRKVTDEEILAVHTRAHLDFIRSTQYMSEEELIELDRTGDSIYFNKLSWQSATLSAGGAIETCKAVFARKVKNAFAVIRPPGHHSESTKAGGFCLFNNVSIASRACQKMFKETCRKIMILDWDVHHGNGIQEVFYDDPNVLYISIHVHKNGRFYPGGDYGDHLHCGSGPGLGKNVNIPWPSQGMGDGDYLFAFQKIVMPIAYEFDPDFVIIAAGFDAAAGDELGGCFVSPTGYAHMTHMLMALAGGKLAVCLEGGYNLKSISKSAVAVVRTLMGEPPERIDSIAASKAGVQTVQKVIIHQSRYWRCMFPKDVDLSLKNSIGGERMHDVVRLYQAKILYDQYKMINLYILRDRISKSFMNQVLATSNYHKAQPLLVIFHDPPDVTGIPDPSTQKLELHNTWITDEVKVYIDWAYRNGFGIIDVNVPKHITDIDVHDEYDSEQETRQRETLNEELAIYLWENYIECNDATEIFFLGVGEASHGFIQLMNVREQSQARITGVICFIADHVIRQVGSSTNPYVADWYYNRSLIFVSESHFVWNPQRKAPKRRFGHLLKSPRKHVSEMLQVHKDQVTEFMLDRVPARSPNAVVLQPGATNPGPAASTIDFKVNSPDSLDRDPLVMDI